MSGQKTVWVTGASSGLGLHTAMALRDDGWRVIAGARSFDDSEADGMIRLKLETDTDYYGSYPPGISLYYSDRISYAGTTTTIRPQYRAGTGDHFVGYVEVPGEWSGKEVTFSVCRKSVTVTLGASPAVASTIIATAHHSTSAISTATAFTLATRR